MSAAVAPSRPGDINPKGVHQEEAKHTPSIPAYAYDGYDDYEFTAPGVFFPGLSRPCDGDGDGRRCRPSPPVVAPPASPPSEGGLSFRGDDPVPLALAVVLIVVPVVLAAICLSCCCICTAQRRREAEHRHSRADVATTRFLAAMAARGTPLPPSTERSTHPSPPPAGIPFLCLNPDDTFALGLLEFPTVPRSTYLHSYADAGAPDSAPLSTHLSVDFRRDVILEDSEASSPRSPSAAIAAAAISATVGIGTHGHPHMHAAPHPLSHASSHLQHHVNSIDGEAAPQPLSPVPGTATPPASIGPANTELSLFSTHPRSFAAAAAAASAFSLHSNGSSRFSDIRWPITSQSMAEPSDLPDGAITIHQNPYAFMLDRGVMDPAQWSGGMGGLSMWSRGSVAARGGRFHFGSIISSRGGRRADRGDPVSRDIAEWAAVDVPCYRVELPADFDGWLAGGAASTLAGAASATTFWGSRPALRSLRSMQSVGSGGSERGGGSSFWQRISFTGGGLVRRRSHGSGDHPELVPRQGSGRGSPGFSGMRSYINALAEPHVVVAGDGGSVHGRRAISLGSSGMLPLRHGLLSREAADHSRGGPGVTGYMGAYGARNRRSVLLPRSARGTPDSGGNFWGLPAWPEGPGRPIPVDYQGEVPGETHLAMSLGAAPSVLLVEDLGEYTGSINIARQDDVGDVPSLWTGPPRVVEPAQAVGMAVPWGDLTLPSQGMHVLDSRTASAARPHAALAAAMRPSGGSGMLAACAPATSDSVVASTAAAAAAAAAAEAGEAQSVQRAVPSRGGSSSESPSYWTIMNGGFMDGVGSPRRFFERDDRIAEAVWPGVPGAAPADEHLKTVYEDASGDIPLEWAEEGSDETEGTQNSVTIDLTSIPAN